MHPLLGVMLVVFFIIFWRMLMTLFCWHHLGKHYSISLMSCKFKQSRLTCIVMSRKLVAWLLTLNAGQDLYWKVKQFSFNGNDLTFVTSFKYLGYVIGNNLTDNDDVKREIRNLYIHTNVLSCRYSKCSTCVKIKLFKLYVFLWCCFMVSLYCVYYEQLQSLL